MKPVKNVAAPPSANCIRYSCKRPSLSDNGDTLTELMLGPGREGRARASDHAPSWIEFEVSSAGRSETEAAVLIVNFIKTA
jgi:hypothetical protein